MLHHLVSRLAENLAPARTPPTPTELSTAADWVLTADPLDIVLYMEQVWDTSLMFDPADEGTIPAPFPGRVVQQVEARDKLWGMGRFSGFKTVAASEPWDHLGYAYVVENTRIIQILKRIVRQYRTGESLGVPSYETRRWLDVTEALLFGASNPLSAWLSTSSVRPDSESNRRNAYWRLFGLDLSFGSEDNGAVDYVKAAAANTGFVAVLEELFTELWIAIVNLHNRSGEDRTDDDRIYRLADHLGTMLRSRRQDEMLLREELAASTALAWAELSISFNTPLVKDLRADATNPGGRLKLLGERVGLPAHPYSDALLSMGSEFSLFLRTIEADLIKSSKDAALLYVASTTAAGTGPIGTETRRVITEWSAATGKNLKERSRPIEIRQTPSRLVAVQ